MPVTDRTVMDTLLMRREVDRYLATVDNELYRMWRTAWAEIGDEFALAIQELIDIGDGEWPSRAQVLRAQRAQNALKAMAETLGALVPGSEVAARSQLRDLMVSAQHWTQQLISTQLPAYDVSQVWARADAAAINQIVARTTSRIHALHRPLTAEMERNMKAVLIRGVMVGDNPVAAARQLLGRCLQVFDGGRARAANIARTEMLDAHRAAARQSRLANKDVVKGWKWHATLSARTCPACISQHGSTHAANEPGPLGHQQCRCTAVPITKTWRELGIDQPEPRDDFPNARAWFRQQPRAVKVQIMGRERLRQLESGELDWQDLSTRVENPHWRPSYVVAPLTGGKPNG